MFTHDPFQAYQTLAAFGGATPYGLPYQAMNPLAFGLQPLAHQGIGGYAHYPQQLQGWPQQLQGYGQQLQGWPQQGQGYGQQLQGWNPLAAGLQNPIPHPLGHPGLQNQLQPQNPLLNPQLSAMLAYQSWQQQQTPFPYPLAPQSFIGGAGIGQPYGQLSPQMNPQFNPQINPLAQLALRQGGLGLSPYAGY
jgi:hypothetical protein